MVNKEDEEVPTVREVMQAYTAAWNATDPEVRGRLLEQAMTEDATVTYPNVEGRGREGISSAIARVQEILPGARFVPTSGIEEHHGWVRFGWRRFNADGSLLGEGEDVVEVADDGRFTRVLGFRNPLPPLS
jgi:hypothetical protein